MDGTPPQLRHIVAPVSPFSEEADRHTVTWARINGLVWSESAERRLAATKPGLLAAHCYPSASCTDLCLLADWMTWLFLLDDQIDEGEHSLRPDALERELTAVYWAGVGHAPPETGGGPLGAALGDILHRLEGREVSDRRWLLRFHQHLLEYFTACVWQAAHRATGHLLSPETFPEMRRRAGAIMPSFDLIEVVEGTVLAPGVYYSNVYQRLLTTAANVVCWTNDVMTWEKEAAHGDPHNLVLLVSQTRGVQVDQAIAYVVADTDREIGRFLAAERELADELRQLDPGREKLSACVALLRAWMRGHVEWGRETARYREVAQSGGALKDLEDLFTGHSVSGSAYE